MHEMAITPESVPFGLVNGLYNNDLVDISQWRSRQNIESTKPTSDDSGSQLAFDFIKFHAVAGNYRDVFLLQSSAGSTLKFGAYLVLLNNVAPSMTSQYSA